jgi:hypothetical protein
MNNKQFSNHNFLFQQRQLWYKSTLWICLTIVYFMMLQGDKKKEPIVLKLTVQKINFTGVRAN